MREQRLSVALVVGLLATGAFAVRARVEVRAQRKVAREDEVWRLRYRLQLKANDDGARLRVSLPDDSDRNRVIGQEFDHANLQGSVPRRSSGLDRQLECLAGHAGTFEVKAEVDIHVRPQAAWRDPATTRPLSTEERQRYLKSAPNLSLESPGLRAALESFESEGATKAELVGRSFAFCRDQIARGKSDKAGPAVTQRRGSPLGRARALVAFCRLASVPARLVAGFELETASVATPRVWVEARLDEVWRPYDPTAGFEGRLPPTRVTVRRGGHLVVDVSKGDTVAALYEIRRGRPPPGLLAPDRAEWTEILDLTRLPLPLRRLLATLLLLPFGAVIIGVFRNLIGLRTFGTFAPVLLALAFVYSDVRSGLLVLAIILGGGLAIRHVLDALKLLMVARLGVVLTVVVTSLVLGISAVEFYSTAPNPQAVILPLVILTGLVEQIYITGEEDSVGYVLKLIGGTTLVALCCFAVLSHVALGRWILRYPEAHLFTMAALILIGRYAGYRLTELWRFHDLIRRPAPAASAAEEAGGAESPGGEPPEEAEEVEEVEAQNAGSEASEDVLPAGEEPGDPTSGVAPLPEPESPEPESPEPEPREGR